MKQLKRSFLSVFVLVLLLTLIMQPAASYASSSASIEALTTPPPQEMGVYGYFDPKFKYLKEGSSTIVAKGGGKLVLTADTNAFSKVSSLGATLYLQKWDGKQWIIVGDGVPRSKNDDYMFSGSAEKIAIKGYYYRVKAVHWITMGDVNEEGVTYSNSILAE